MKTPESIKKIIKEISYKDTSKNEYTYIINEKGFKEVEHRFIWRMKYGSIPLGGVIHHINENKKDNRIENLMFFPNGAAHMNYHKNKRRTEGVTT